MRSTLLLSLLLACTVTAGANAQKVNISVRNGSLDNVLRQITEQTPVQIVYNTETAARIRYENLEIRQTDMGEVLDQVLSGTGLTYELEDGIYIIRERRSQQPQQVQLVTVRGVVLDTDGHAIQGVTVVVPGTTTGVTTDPQGRFAIGIPATVEQPTLRFSFVGMETQTVRVEQRQLTVVMKQAAQTIADVVITGYQELDRRKLTSAVTSMKMDDIAIPGVNTVDQMLEGNVPGMIYMQSTGQVGAAPKLRVRGSSSILGNQEPLWVVDGIIVQDKVNVDPAQLNDLDFVNLLGNAISGLNPADIEQIDVLKDAAATALYGARAANGVIVITTRRGTIGAPTVSYSMSGTFTPRPRYTDRGFHMMNSRERVDVSRELLEKGVRYSDYYPGVTDWIGYERAYMDYYNENTIDFAEFKRLSQWYETMNTDWLDLLTRDVFSHNHTVSLNGGSENIRYYASVGFANEKGSVRDEKSDRYTA